MPLRSKAKFASTGDLLPSLQDYLTRWFFYCECGRVWSTLADPDARCAPHQKCLKCNSRVKGGL